VSGFLKGYDALFNLCMLNALLALSQYVVLRAGVFSLATAGLAAFGAYAAANAILAWKVGVAPAVLLGALSGMVCALALSLPLARLRGVYQAIATLAFVQIVVSLALFADGVTGGATGLNGIPKSVQTWHIALTLTFAAWIVNRVGASAAGLAFDIARQDETVAVSLGVDVAHHHRLAFALSGALAGTAGALMAGHNYSVVPEEFGFSMLVAALSFVILGGRQSVFGPIVGAVMLTLLPEVARPLADNRMVLYGALLMAVIVYLPHGIVDSLVLRRLRSSQRRVAASPAAAVEAP
jgi:branched-chain amino acid transport system permease protein